MTASILRQQVRDHLGDILRAELARDTELFKEVWELCVRADDLGVVESELARLINRLEEIEDEPEVEPTRVSVAESRGRGFTGDICNFCGGLHMVRNGSCLLCNDCGMTTGCS